VGFMRRAGTAVALLVAFAALTAAAPRGTAEGSIAVSVLLDLGDGTYVWSSVDIEDRLAPNATFDAIVAAADAHGLAVEWTWDGDWGAAITDVGDRDPTSFVGVYLWNRTAGAWNFTDVGVTTLVLEAGDVLAVSNAGYGGVAFEERFPAPTPERPYPVLAFRGDAWNSGAAASSAPSTNRLLWDSDVGVPEIAATPAIAYGYVFVNTMRELFALDEDTGDVAWRNPGVRGFSSPAVFSGTLVVGTSDGRVVQVDAATGRERWNTTLVSETVFSGITSSPKIAFDRIYVGTLNESGGPGEVVALDVRDGSVAWRHATGSIHYSSPALAGGILHVGVMGLLNTTSGIDFDPPHGVLALDARDGSEIWFFETEGPVAASPVVFGDLVVAPSKESHKDGVVYGIRRSDGAQAWRADVPAGVSSPALHGDTVFVGGGSLNGTGRVTALNASSGVERWSVVLNGPVQASVAYADSKVYVSTNTAQGTIYALDPATGDTLWSYTPTPAQYILGSPVVADGIVFAPSDNGHVYAFGEPPEDVGYAGFLNPITLSVVLVAAVAVGVAAFVSLRRRRHA